MSRLACTAVLIPTLLLSSSHILQVHAICKCGGIGPGRCFECSCKSGTCELFDQIRNIQQCKRDLKQIDPSSSCMTANCEDPRCLCNDTEKCSKCGCIVDDNKCQQISEGCIAARNRNLHRCCNLLTAIASCDDCASCEESDGCGDDTSESNMTVVIIAVLVSLVVVILITIASVTLICYWRYKLKVTKETLSHTTHKSMQENVAYNVGQHNQIPSDDPLYSVLDGETSNSYTHPQDFPAVSPHDTQPPQLPTSRRPYYEEIESDFKESASIPTDYEQPVKATTTKTLSEPFKASSTNKKGMDDYQEPADALKENVSYNAILNQQVHEGYEGTQENVAALSQPVHEDMQDNYEKIKNIEGTPISVATS